MSLSVDKDTVLSQTRQSMNFVATTNQSYDSTTALYYSSPAASRGRSVRTGRQDAGHRRASLYRVRSSICDNNNSNNNTNSNYTKPAAAT